MHIPGILGDNPEWFIKRTKHLYKSHILVSHFAYDLHSDHSPTCFHTKMSISPKPSASIFWEAVFSTRAV